MSEHQGSSDAENQEQEQDQKQEQEPPLLRIVKGDPTPEEVAALVSVVSAMAAGAAEAASKQARPKPEWAAHHRKLRGTHRHGPGAWRAHGR